MKKINQQIRDYLDYCKNICQMSPTTISNKQSILANFARETELDTIEELTDQKYTKWAKQKSKRQTLASSINTYNSTIVALVRFFRNAGLEVPLNLNTIPHLKTQRTPRKFYTAQEIARALEKADETEELMIEIMSETGMRIAELANLKTENLNHHKITFIGKGHKPREVYLRQETSFKLQEYLETYHIYNGYIWCVVNGVKTINGEPPTVHTIRKSLKEVFERAGFAGFYPHALRHSFATNLQKKGASLSEIKEMMGHSSVATTERYLHGFDGKLEELFNKYR